MTDRLEIINPADTELKKQLEAIRWPVEYGVVSLQIRNGKPTMLKIERTVKLD